MSAAEVRREDQVLINEFGRLNAHARELREERALLQKRLEEVDDATTELAMGDGDDVCIPRRAAAPATRRRARAGARVAAHVVVGLDAIYRASAVRSSTVPLTGPQIRLAVVDRQAARLGAAVASGVRPFTHHLLHFLQPLT